MNSCLSVYRVLGLCLLGMGVSITNAWVPLSPFHHSPLRSRTVTTTRVLASTQEEGATVTSTKPKVQELGLLTFDLDDTLYPIEPVVKAANGTFFLCVDRYMLWLYNKDTGLTKL